VSFLETMLGKWLMTAGIAMVPVVELRGAIPFGLAAGLSPWQAYWAAVIGNLIPVPFIMLLIRKIFAWLRRRPWWGPRIDRLERRAHLKGQTVRKYRLPGLVILVAIPLPGTGAWTGALVADALDLRLGLAMPAIFAGLLIAGGITLAVSCGVLTLL
jgi:Predicted membrane protein